MCDYSLSGVPNRQAIEGERLVTYRFPNGVKGFVSQPELSEFVARHANFWSRFCAWFRSETPCAVCLSPGAKLVLRDVPDAVAIERSGDGDQLVEFTQGGSQYEYRDGVRFHNGATLLLQQLPPGLIADILSVKTASSSQTTKPDSIKQALV